MERVLITTPYVGELGWCVFSWAPMVHAAALAQPWDKVIVYTRPGRSLLYPYATEVRPNPLGPEHESECLLWHGFDEEMSKQYNAMIDQVVAQGKEEFGPETVVFSIASLKQFNQAFYDKGKPCLLKLPEGKRPVTGDKLRPINVLCTRDRGMSDYRNWAPENWRKLADSLPGTVIVVGKSEREYVWKEAFADCDVDRISNRINKTSINDLVRLFSVADIAIGGSTGTLHLASSCACDHLVWGGEKEIHRYAETNWFGARHHVLSIGWDPEVEQIANAIKEFSSSKPVSSQDG